jgi:hypothetical protein
MARGGYQQPSSPAPVSGPGALSKRTDGQPVRSPGGMAYGENADFADLQSSAPMAQAATATPNVRQGSAAANGAPSLTPFGAPTERPDEPLTEGNPMGPGAGPGALSVPAGGDAAAALDADRRTIAMHLPSLLRMAEKDTAPEGFRMFVRHLRNLG